MGPGPDLNHAKIGVSKSPTKRYAIFGDMKQQRTLSGNCANSQNGRGGLLYVADNRGLFDGITELIRGEKTPTKALGN
jgi:hypothetical protein